MDYGHRGGGGWTRKETPGDSLTNSSERQLKQLYHLPGHLVEKELNLIEQDLDCIRESINTTVQD